MGNSGDEYNTPPWLFRALHKRFHFLTDVCTQDHNPLNTTFFFTKEDNGLKQDWQGPCYCNPPYSNPGPWLKKAHQEAWEKGTLTVLLLRADPSTQWWNTYVTKADAVIHIPHRLKFYLDGVEQGAYNFPSCIVIIGGLKGL